MRGYETDAKMNPPLRTAKDVDALREAVKDGTIDVIATDHAPHHYDEKEREFENAPNGIVGLETALAVVVTNLVEKGYLTFTELVDRMACTPARLFKLPGGTLKRGAVGDVTVFDPKARWTVNASEFASKGRNSPYNGMTLVGRAACTIVAGRSSIDREFSPCRQCRWRSGHESQAEETSKGISTMAEREPVSLDALNGLLKERQRYEEWLTALEQRRENTSESVFARVHADYQTRLREVSSKLAERAGELRESIDTLSARLEEISRQELQQREARQEAELRAAVGEYTDKQWKEIGGAWDKELARLSKEKTAVDTQLTELNRIFALSMKEKQAEEIMHRVALMTAIAPISPWSHDRQSRAADSSTHPAGSKQFRATAPTQSTPRTPFDDFPVLRPGTGTVTPPSTTAVATPPSVPRSGGTQDPRSEQHKTLKCPECGAANYPTEWYCERCGGELATM